MPCSTKRSGCGGARRLLEFSHLDFAWGFAARLEERRLVATEDRIDADLRLGRHTAVVGELGELVAANPLREQLRHHMALALYRSGRQAEALRILDDARRTLRNQLGIDPGRPLVDLEAAILSQDPALTLEPAASPGPASRDTSPTGTGLVGQPGGPGAGVVASTDAAVTDVPPAALVGREVELRQAIAALDEARAAARVVLVEGEPGIGKTRLLEELTAEARRRGVTVLWGHAYEGGATPAFWPWLPVVRALVARGGAAAAAPELTTLLERDDDADDAGPGDRTRFRVLEAVTALLADAAAEAPLVVVLDDLQWADLASLEVLTFVARELGDRPVLLAGTVRELEVGRNDSVVEALATLSRVHSTRRVALRGLSHLQTAELLRAATGRDLEPAVVAAIQDRAEGNPFFATELAHLVEAERDPDRSLGAVSAGGDVPSSVRDVVRRRTALLPEPTVRLLQVSAVVGREADLDLLVRAADQDVDAVLDDLDPAIVHHLVVPVADRPGTFRFAHALVREVVVDDVSSLRRARIHLRVADAIEATSGDRDDAAEILAEHLWAAAPIGVGRRAAAALERAAEVAVGRYAFESAEVMLDRAVRLRRSAGSDEDVEAELLATCRLLSIQRSLHGYASVADSPHLRRGQDLARRTARPDILARILWTEWAAYDSRCDYGRSDPIAEVLDALSSETDDALVRVTGRASLGISNWHQGRLTEASALLDEAVQVGAGATAPAMTLGLDLEVLLLPHPFSRYLHTLVGDGRRRRRGGVRGPRRRLPRPLRRGARRDAGVGRGGRRRPARVGHPRRPARPRRRPRDDVRVLGVGQPGVPGGGDDRPRPARRGPRAAGGGHDRLHRGRGAHGSGRLPGQPGRRPRGGRPARRGGRGAGRGGARDRHVRRALRGAPRDRGRRPAAPRPGRRPGRRRRPVRPGRGTRHRAGRARRRGAGGGDRGPPRHRPGGGREAERIGRSGQPARGDLARKHLLHSRPTGNASPNAPRRVALPPGGEGHRPAGRRRAVPPRHRTPGGWGVPPDSAPQGAMLFPCYAAVVTSQASATRA